MDRRQRLMYGNNGSNDVRQQLLDGAPLRLDNITHSVIATAGAITPSMTRATTKRVIDSWGRQVTCLAGEVAFPGARRVENLWGTATATLASGNSNTMTLPAGTYIFSMGVGAGRATFSGTGGATGTLDASASARVSVTKTITAGTLIVTASLATLTDLMVENRTGCSDTTTPSSFVSIGIEASPAYHGSCVDGVKCFPTDLSGNPLTGMTTPLIELAATQLIATTADIRDMTTASWTLGATMTRARTSVGLDGSANSATRLTGGAVAATNTITYTLVAAASSRTYSAYVKRITGTGPVRLTQDGFATNTDISSQLVNGSWILVQLNQSQLNAVMGFKIDTNGDAIDVDFNQFEAGAGATSRIATGGAVRNADQLYWTGALFANVKTLLTRGYKRDAGFSSLGVIAALSDGTVNNYVESFFNSSATDVRFQGGAAAATQWAQSASNAYTPGQLSNAAQSFTANDIKMAKDGVAQTQDTSATVPTVSRLEYGMVAGAFQLNGYPGKVYGWTRNLSQSELNAITT